MPFAAFFDYLSRGKASSHVTLAFPNEEALPVTGGPGYFQVRLKDMSLAFGREWHQNLVPATFLLADYNYGGKPIRHPFFVSNAMLSGLPAGVDAEKLRIRFRDTMVIGPTPYMGGDVALFVGLFKSVIADRRKDTFTIFEKLFGSVDIAGFSQYLAVANKLSETIFDCLASKDIQCVLAERRVVIAGDSPLRSSYLVMLGASNGGAINTTGLVMHKGELMRQDGAAFSAPDGLDFCVLSIERMALRDDYAALPFHAVWQQARAMAVVGKVAEAQALMLQCAAQIFASADLSEDHKVGLIEFYQARLLAVKSLLSTSSRFAEAGAAASMASRNDQMAPARLMQTRALAAEPSLDRKKLDRHIKRIDTLSHLFAADAAQVLVEQPDKVWLDQITKYLSCRSDASPQDGNAAFLSSALAAGSIEA